MIRTARTMMGNVCDIKATFVNQLNKIPPSKQASSPKDLKIHINVDTSAWKSTAVFAGSTCNAIPDNQLLV